MSFQSELFSNYLTLYFEVKFFTYKTDYFHLFELYTMSNTKSGFN